MKRAWKTQKGLEGWKEIDSATAGKELANAHGGGVEGIENARKAALYKLKSAGTLETQFAIYKA